MAAARPLLTTTSSGRAVTSISAHSRIGYFLATAATLETSRSRYGPLRQSQFNRYTSTTSSPQPPAPSTSRSIHSATTNGQAGAVLFPQASTGSDFAPPNMAPLAVLPFTTVARSLAVTSLSSSPVLLPPSLSLMSLLAHTTNPFLDPDRNPLLKQLIKKTFYAHFCAGEEAGEVRATMARLRDMGFTGVILGHAREVALSSSQLDALEARGLDSKTEEESMRTEVGPWAEGTMETIRLAAPGDYVALKFTGAGRGALWALSKDLPPPKALADAIEGICDLAAQRGVMLQFDAEQQAVQKGIDDWTLQYMRKYNKGTHGKAVVHGSYQAYLKAMPAVLAEHLRIAKEEGFTLGVKLVRGAYLASDPRHLIHDTKADTDACYDGIVEALLHREWRGALAPYAPENTKAVSFPDVNLVLATHNARSVRKARAILDAGHRDTDVAFAQLQGMADEVSCELLAAKDTAAATAHNHSINSDEAKAAVSQPRAYKYLVWGSTGECMKYLLRRAQENKDAVQRTKSGRDAMRAELWRRFKGVFGLA